MSETLKPCPRCGGEMRTYNSDDNAAGYTWSVMCVNPECIDQEVFATKEAAVAAANRRTPGPATAKLVDVAKEVMGYPIVLDNDNVTLMVGNRGLIVRRAVFAAFIAEHEPRP